MINEFDTVSYELFKYFQVFSIIGGLMRNEPCTYKQICSIKIFINKNNVLLYNTYTYKLLWLG